jgi:hypothetical protein
VTVISQERIGSFTAFVLAATDAGALKKWLDDNELATTPSSEAWLKHYVDIGFHFVAFRYETDAKGGGGRSKTETVRISFATPRPFYPYLEPLHAEPPPSAPRVLAVWLVSPERGVPVAAVKDGEGDAIRWKRPWKEARLHAPTTTASLAASLGPSLGALVPAGAPGRLVVQTFLDQKQSRRGWGDVVVVPASPEAIDAAKMKRMRKLMTSLDFAIGGGS